MKFLYAAYFVTWAIHFLYLLNVTRGYKKMAEEIRDLEKK
jgi:CcmD family protein